MIEGTVGIGYCHGGMVHEPFFRSLMASWMWDHDRMRLYSGYFGVGGLYIAINRNKVCEEFLKKDAEWLWFLDTDIVFREDTCYRLLQHAHAVARPILSAVYFGRMLGGNKLQPVALKEMHPGEYATLSQLSSDLYLVDGVGMGCCLIHRSVLEKMREVYNQDEWNWFGHDTVQKLNGQVTHLGEDITFCRRAQSLGYTIHIDGNVVVGHIKSRMEDLDTFISDSSVEFQALTNSAA